jgi:hypothetical protein
MRAHVYNLTVSSSGHHAVSESQDQLSLRLYHLDHCFDYLRQSIRCSADVTLEWLPVASGGGKENVLDGWGIPHRECKSVEAIEAFIFKNRATLDKAKGSGEGRV